MGRLKELYLPNTTTYDNLIELMKNLFDKDHENYTKIRLHTGNIRYYETPAIVALKIAEYNTLSRKGLDSFWIHLGDSVTPFVNYLSRMNYFYNYQKKPPVNFNSYPANNRFLELTETTAGSVQEDLRKLAGTFTNVLNDDLFLQSIRYSFGEIHSNILDHSGQRYGILMSQYFPTKNCLQICLADNGIGIKKSLEEKWIFDSHIDAIMKSLEKKVTSANPSKSMYGGKTNVGLGLYFTKRICEELNWELQIISGSGYFYKTRFDGTTSYEYSDFYFPGTLLALKCYYSDYPLYDYPELMDKLRAEVNDNMVESQVTEDDFDWDDVF